MGPRNVRITAARNWFQVTMDAHDTSYSVEVGRKRGGPWAIESSGPSWSPMLGPERTPTDVLVAAHEALLSVRQDSSAQEAAVPIDLAIRRKRFFSGVKLTIGTAIAGAATFGLVSLFRGSKPEETKKNEAGNLSDTISKGGM